MTEEIIDTLYVNKCKERGELDEVPTIHFCFSERTTSSKLGSRVKAIYSNGIIAAMHRRTS